jgi:hypothetical protein
MILERVLVWLCGENYEVLRFHQRDKVPYLFIGLFIVASAVLAGAAAVALLQLLWSVPLAAWIPIALLAALVSMGLDRFLVAALLSREATSRGVYVAVLIPRALLGVISAICAATLVLMQFATFDVNRQIVAAQHQNSQAFYAALSKSKLATDISVEQEFVAALNAHEEQLNNLKVQLQIVQKQETYTLQNYYCLRNGPCAPRGDDSAVAQTVKQEYDAQVNQASQISSMISSLENKDAAAAGTDEAKLPAVEAQLNSTRAAQAKLIRSFQASNNHPGLLARLLAAYQATDRGWASVARWVFILLLGIIACAPVYLKRRLTLKPETQYEMAMSERSSASRGRGMARAERREEGRRLTARGSDAEAGTATIEEIYRLLAEWVRKLPSTRDEVTAIGSRITNVLLRDWQRRQ